MESQTKKVEDIRVRITMTNKNNALACISDIEYLRKLIPGNENNKAGEIGLNAGDIITHEGSNFEIKDVKIRFYNSILDLEKFGVNVCGVGMESPYNFQIICNVEKI